MLTPTQLAAAVAYNSSRPYTAATWQKVQKLVGASPDGKPGKETARKVAAWQAAAGLEEDGQVGPETLRALNVRPDTGKKAQVLALPELALAYPDLTFGIDVSGHQGVIDWQAVAAAGVKFAIVKLSEWKQLDGRGADNLAGARAAGLDVSAYTYAHLVWEGRPTDPVSYAEHFAGLLDGAEGWLDLETERLKMLVDLRGAEATAEWIEAWVAAFAREAGRPPGLYLSRWGAQLLGPHAGQLPQLRSWWVDYVSPVVDEPIRRPGWESWTIRQFTGRGKAEGIAGKVDLDFSTSFFS